jgi:hypothetical protein
MRYRKPILFLYGGIFILIVGGFVAMVGISLGLLAVDFWWGNSQGSVGKVVIKTISDYVPVTPDKQVDSELSTGAGPASKPIPLRPVQVQPVNNPDPASAPHLRQEPGMAAPALNSPLPTLTPTLPPNPTPTSVLLAQSAVTATPSPIVSTAPTAGPSPTIITPNRISGRVLLNGQAVNDGLLLKLEDAAGRTVAETTVAEDGRFTFANVASSSEGYVVVFAQEWNPQFDMGEVISWGWLGHVPVETAGEVALPDFDISLQGFEQVSPEPNATFSAATVSSSEPIQFEWQAYPEASNYWLDLIQEGDQDVLWQSAPVQDLSLNFDGKTENGAPIQPGEYWWGVGARRQMDDYTLAVYGYLPALLIDQ